MAEKNQRNLRTWIEIDRQALASNFKHLNRIAGTRRAMAVVKSNAYGHGMVLVAKFLSTLTPDTHHLLPRLWFGVDSITEAMRLRKERIKNPILVLGYTLPEKFSEAGRKNISVTVAHFEGLDALVRLKTRPQFHLKIDSGMHRQGFQASDIPRLIAELEKHHLAPRGVYSHLAKAEDAQASKKQRQAFESCLAMLRGAGIRPGIIHMNGTGGAILRPRSRYDMVRLGIGLYGYLPSRDYRYPVKRNFLKPALTWKTIVAEVKQVKKGERIGYDLTERLKRDTLVAILPVGYWHGLDRGLSSIGEALIRGRRAKILGRVSMDITAVDATGIRGVKVGDEVALIGRQGRDAISADEMAAKINTISYEVLTRINPLIERVLI